MSLDRNDHVDNSLPPKRGTLKHLPGMVDRMAITGNPGEKEKINALIEALEAVDIADFLPEGVKGRIVDSPMPIGNEEYQVNMTRPLLSMKMLLELDVGPGQTVLEIGYGSGFVTALLAHLVGPQGRVVGLEIHPDIAKFGEQNIGKYPELKRRIKLYTDDAALLTRTSVAQALGAQQQTVKGFDRIFCAAQMLKIPDSIAVLLERDGVMILPKQHEARLPHIAYIKKAVWFGDKLITINPGIGHPMPAIFIPFMRKDEQGRFVQNNGETHGK
ncbi:MAG: hypothetical protein NTX63_01650 [Candidatus Peregrinibacteria bacterium]|nr:hypothetical protein [Candidatus Peregrinibacteria bacterium]